MCFRLSEINWSTDWVIRVVEPIESRQHSNWCNRTMQFYSLHTISSATQFDDLGGIVVSSVGTRWGGPGFVYWKNQFEKINFSKMGLIWVFWIAFEVNFVALVLLGLPYLGPGIWYGCLAHKKKNMKPSKCQHHGLDSPFTHSHCDHHSHYHHHLHRFVLSF